MQRNRSGLGCGCGYAIVFAVKSRWAKHSPQACECSWRHGLNVKCPSANIWWHCFGRTQDFGNMGLTSLANPGPWGWGSWVVVSWFRLTSLHPDPLSLSTVHKAISCYHGWCPCCHALLSMRLEASVNPFSSNLLLPGSFPMDERYLLGISVCEGKKWCWYLTVWLFPT